MAIETPNPVAIIVVNCAAVPVIASGQQYLDALTPVTRTGAGEYYVYLRESLPVVQSPFLQDAAVMASVQSTNSTAAGDGRVVEASPRSTNQREIAIKLRSAVTGALADDATIVLTVLRQPTAS